MMAKVRDDGAPLPMILIMDMDNEGEQFIFFNPPSEPGKPGSCEKIREGLWKIVFQIVKSPRGQ